MNRFSFSTFVFICLYGSAIAMEQDVDTQLQVLAINLNDLADLLQKKSIEEGQEVPPPLPPREEPPKPEPTKPKPARPRPVSMPPGKVPPIFLPGLGKKPGEPIEVIPTEEEQAIQELVKKAQEATNQLVYRKAVDDLIKLIIERLKRQKKIHIPTPKSTPSQLVKTINFAPLTLPQQIQNLYRMKSTLPEDKLQQKIYAQGLANGIQNLVQKGQIKLKALNTSVQDIAPSAPPLEAILAINPETIATILKILKITKQDKKIAIFIDNILEKDPFTIPLIIQFFETEEKLSKDNIYRFITNFFAKQVKDLENLAADEEVLPSELKEKLNIVMNIPNAFSGILQEASITAQINAGITGKKTEVDEAKNFIKQIKELQKKVRELTNSSAIKKLKDDLMSFYEATSNPPERTFCAASHAPQYVRFANDLQLTIDRINYFNNNMAYFPDPIKNYVIQSTLDCINWITTIIYQSQPGICFVCFYKDFLPSNEPGFAAINDKNLNVISNLLSSQAPKNEQGKFINTEINIIFEVTIPAIKALVDLARQPESSDVEIQNFCVQRKFLIPEQK